MMRWSPTLGLAVAILVAGASQSAVAETFSEKINRTLPDSLVQELLTASLKNLQHALCEKGQPCLPATEEELAHPPITLVVAREVIVQSATAALMKFCGLDYKRSFLPMMMHYRNEQMNDRKLALIALLHGISQGQQLQALQKQLKKCPEDLKAKLDAALPKL